MAVVQGWVGSWWFWKGRRLYNIDSTHLRSGGGRHWCFLYELFNT